MAPPETTGEQPGRDRPLRLAPARTVPLADEHDRLALDALAGLLAAPGAPAAADDAPHAA